MSRACFILWDHTPAAVQRLPVTIILSVSLFLNVRDLSIPSLESVTHSTCLTACSQTKGRGEQDAISQGRAAHRVVALPTWQHGLCPRGGPELTAKGVLRSGGIFNNFGEINNIKTKIQHSTWNRGEHSGPHSACCTPAQLSRDMRSPWPSPELCSQLLPLSTVSSPLCRIHGPLPSSPP